MSRSTAVVWWLHACWTKSGYASANVTGCGPPVWQGSASSSGRTSRNGGERKEDGGQRAQAPELRIWFKVTCSEAAPPTLG